MKTKVKDKEKISKWDLPPWKTFYEPEMSFSIYYCKFDKLMKKPTNQSK